MRGGMTEPAGMGGTVDRVADLGEEDRVRHRRIVPFPGEMGLLHPERAIAAIRRIVAGDPGRDWPRVADLPIDRDAHALGVLVDGDEKVGPRRQRRGCQNETRGEEGQAQAHGSDSGWGEGENAPAAPRFKHRLRRERSLPVR